MKVRVLMLLAIIIVTLSACTPSARFGSKRTGKLVGYATYYGPGFHGKKTASGEVFDMYKMTCAHRTLPFGTILIVTNISNNKSIKVRVNDRGPFVKGVIIDLSMGAAKKIDLDGKEKVEIEILK